MKKLSLSLAVVMLLGVIGSAQAKPTTVWEDESGDATLAGQAPQSLPGGFDLVSGSIERVGTDLIFSATMADMPPAGTLPEGFRFLWAFSVGKDSYRITAKTADIGKPDALAMNGTERVGRADAMGHFRLEGDCAAGEQVGILIPINCQTLEYLTGTFDPATTSLSVTVPMKPIKAKKGSVIAVGGGDSAGICQICWVAHTAERSHQDTIIDSAFMAATYKVR